MYCTNCNAQLDADDIFCGDCGTPVPVQAAASGGMSCSKCGQAMKPDDVFCSDCGTPVTPPPQPAPIYQPPPQPTPTYTQAPHSTVIYNPSVSPTISTSQARVPLMFIVDTSSAAASYLSELNKEINNLKTKLDTQVSQLADIAIVQFGERHGLVQGFTNILRMNPVNFSVSSIPNSVFDPPIRESIRLVADYSRSNKPSHKPWVVLISGSSPTDDISSVINEIKSAQSFDALRFIALGVDKCDFTALNRLTDIVFKQDGIDFTAFFNWLAECMKAISQTPHGQKPQLPNIKGNVYRDK